MTEKKSAYFRAEPKRFSFMWLALLVPAIVYSLGVVVYAHNAFVPGAQGENGHALGSALMIFGGEAGTLAAAAEVFRKYLTKETNPLDWGGLVVSLVATLGNLFVTYAALSARVDPWLVSARTWGPLVMLLCSGVDFYAGVMEFGFYNASFDERHNAWETAAHNAEMKVARDKVQPTAQQAQVIEMAPAPISQEDAKTKQGAQQGADDAPQDETKAACVARVSATGDIGALEVAQLCNCSRQYAQKLMKEAQE